MPDLSDYRREIDRIDVEMTQLFEARMRIVEQVAEYKRIHHMDVMQSGREKDILDRAEKRLENPDYAPYVRRFFDSLMRLSRDRQEDQLAAAQEKQTTVVIKETLICAYPGVPGSNSEQALITYFDCRCRERLSYPLFEDVARAVRDGRCDAGVLPIENSSAGPVAETYDLLDKYHLKIVGECVVPIEHQLLGVPGSTLADIREVHSHPQAIAQCRDFLLAHPDWRIVPSENTAISARFVSETGDQHVAAIANRIAAETYHLHTLAADIHSDRTNTTRFVIISANPAEIPNADKATVTFALDNRVGALQWLIACFAAHDLNMCRIESRPIKGCPWEYLFYADFEWKAGRDAQELFRALEEAKADAKRLVLLGLYEKAVTEE